MDPQPLTQPVLAQPVQAMPVQATPVQAQPVQAQPVQAQPVQAQAIQAQPVHLPAVNYQGQARNVLLNAPAASPTGVDWANPIKLSGRASMTPCQMLFSGVFFGQMLLTLCLMIWVIATANVKISSVIPEGRMEGGKMIFVEPCDDGFMHSELTPLLCIDKALVTEQHTCIVTHPMVNGTARRLGSGLPLHHPSQDLTMWMLMSKHVAMPVTCVVAVFALCVGWLFMLKNAAACVIWSSIAFNSVLLAFGCYLTQNWALGAGAVGILVFSLIRKDAIDLAISAITVGAKAISQTPSVFTACFILQAMWAVYGMAFFYGMTQVGNSLRVSPVTCELTLSVPSDILVRVGMVLYMYTTFWFRNAALAVCSLGIGCWYFPDTRATDPNVNPAMHGLQLCFTSSSGAVSEAAVIGTLVQMLRKKAEEKFWLCDPVACIVKMIWNCIAASVEGMTRFTLISHMFHGGGFRDSAGNMFSILSRHLGKAIIANAVTDSVMHRISLMLGVGVGFAGWYYLDTAEELGIFKAVGKAGQTVVDSSDLDAEGKTKVMALLLYLLTAVMMFFIKHPLATIFVVTFIHGVLPREFLTGSPYTVYFNSFCMAIYLACISTLVFEYFALVVTYSTDVIFYCFALEAEMGKRQDRMSDLYSLLQKQRSLELGGSYQDPGMVQQQQMVTMQQQYPGAPPPYYNAAAPLRV